MQLVSVFRPAVCVYVSVYAGLLYQGVFLGMSQYKLFLYKCECLVCVYQNWCFCKFSCVHVFLQLCLYACLGFWYYLKVRMVWEWLKRDACHLLNAPPPSS